MLNSLHACPLQLVNGMFGGYSAYDHLVCSVLCPLDMSAKYRAALRGHDLVRLQSY